MASKLFKFYKANIGNLIEKYPEIFNKKDPKILKIGIHHDLVKETGLSGIHIRKLLYIWTHRFEYRQRGACGGYRIDLSGNYGEAISEEHIKSFQESLK